MTERAQSRQAVAGWGQITLGSGWHRRAAGIQQRAPKAALTPEQMAARRTEIVTWMFRLFLILVMIRISSGDADSEAARAARQAATAAGDKTKQAAYAFAFILFVATWIKFKGLTLPRCLSVVQYCLVSWILLSTTWAVDQSISIRRSVLLLLVFSTIATAVDLLGPKASLRALYWVLALCMTISLISVPLFSFAVHPPTEIDQSIVGGWRGVFVHKNTAGAIAAVSLLVFLHSWIGRRKWYDALFFAVCLVFLIGSKSKTPALILPFAIFVSLSYRALYRRVTGRLAFLVIMAVIVTSVLIAYLSYQAVITQTLDNPDSFTGRAGLWRVVLDYSADHRWLGAGYSSLWGTSVPPPVIPYTTAPFQQFMLHSHSGYLELLGTIGVPGLCMAVVAAIILPVFEILRDARPESNELNAVVLAIVAFCSFENFFETQLYTRDREVWVCFFIAILSLHLNSRRAKAADRPGEPRRRIVAFNAGLTA